MFFYLRTVRRPSLRKRKYTMFRFWKVQERRKGGRNSWPLFPRYNNGATRNRTQPGNEYHRDASLQKLQNTKIIIYICSPTTWLILAAKFEEDEAKDYLIVILTYSFYALCLVHAATPSVP